MPAILISDFLENFLQEPNAGENGGREGQAG